jgi:hypothetical protein
MDVFIYFVQSKLTSSIFYLTIYISLPNMDLRIEIFMLKLVYTKIFMTEIPVTCVVKTKVSKRHNSCPECSNIMKFSV